MIAVGFEPTKHIARDLESLPFDRSGTLPLIVKIVYQRLFISDKITLCGTRTHNLQIRSLTRYPVAPIGLIASPKGKTYAFFLRKTLMLEVGFEPTKRVASDLKSLPFDRTREP